MVRASLVAGALGLAPACGDDSGVNEDGDDTGSTEASSGESESSSSPPADTTGSSGADAASSSSDASTDESIDDSTSAESTSSGGDGVAPVATDDLFRTPTDAMLSVEAADGVLVNDFEPSGETLQVVDFDTRSERGGSVSVDAFGGFAYTPPEGDWGPDSFQYTVADAGGDVATATVTINITPTVIVLDQIAAGEGGFVIDGDYGDQSGVGIAGAGDVNGDGLEDIAVGSPYEDGIGGRVDIVFGKTDLDAVDLTDIGAGMGGFRIRGGFIPGDANISQVIGYDVAAAGDVNGDGFGDVVLGTRSYLDAETSSLRAYVVFGQDDETEPVDVLDLVGGTGGFALHATGEPTDGGIGETFVRVAGAGDVNGDGLADIVVGIASAVETHRARAWVVFGTDGDVDEVDLDTLGETGGGFVIDAEAERPGSSKWLDGAGDVDGDGLDDLILGINVTQVDGILLAGRAYIVHGKADEDPVVLADLASGEGGFVVQGSSMYEGVGLDVSGAGDLDGDGLDDVVIMSTDDVPYVLRGRTETDTLEFSSIVVDGHGFAIENTGVQYNGPLMVGGRDVDGDGLDDLVLGTDAETSTLGYGRTYVMYGDAAASSVDLSLLENGDGGFVLDSYALAWGTPNAVGIADVNGDGLADVLASNTNPTDSPPYAGITYVVLGTSTAPHD